MAAAPTSGSVRLCLHSTFMYAGLRTCKTPCTCTYAHQFRRQCRVHFHTQGRVSKSISTHIHRCKQSTYSRIHTQILGHRYTRTRTQTETHPGVRNRRRTPARFKQKVSDHPEMWSFSSTLPDAKPFSRGRWNMWVASGDGSRPRSSAHRSVKADVFSSGPWLEKGWRGCAPRPPAAWRSHDCRG